MRIRTQVMILSLAAVAAACGPAAESPAPATDETGGAYDQAQVELSRATREMYVSIALLERLGSDALKIDTTVRGSTATLDGTVPTETAREQAADAALGVTGIDDVDNRLNVAADAGEAAAGAAGSDLAEATLEAKVRLRLLQTLGRDALGIDVTVDGTSVALGGSVASSAVRDEAVTATRETPGVEAVDDHLATR